MGITRSQNFGGLVINTEYDGNGNIISGFLYIAGAEVPVLDDTGKLSSDQLPAPAPATLAVDTTLTASHSIVFCDASGGAFTVTLPTAVGISGTRYVLKRTDATSRNAMTLATTGGQTIDGFSSLLLGTLQCIEVISDGANWYVI